jgi:secreted trypsin-like serine protease
MPSKIEIIAKCILQACYYDSGGPLLDISGKVQYGISATVSSLFKCANGKHPDMYTVSHHHHQRQVVSFLAHFLSF